MVVYERAPRDANAGATATEGTPPMTQEAYRQLALPVGTAARPQPDAPDRARDGESEPVSPITYHRSAPLRTDANTPQSHAAEPRGEPQNPPAAKPQPDRSPPAVETASRSRSNCNCGGPCFYCGRVLSRHRHEHDHFPVPYRYGGSTTVAACRECHSLKDRHAVPGLHRDGTVDEPVWKSILEGMADLPPALDATTGDRVPVVLFALYEYMTDWHEAQRVDWNGGSWLPDQVELLAGVTATSVAACTTPEARIFVARLFTTYLDRVDDALTRRGG